MLHTQCRSALLDGDQAINIRMLARVGPRVIRMLGKNLQALFGRFKINRAVGLGQMALHRQ